MEMSSGNRGFKKAKLDENEGNDRIVFCKNCGARMDAGARFCSSCGQSNNPTRDSHSTVQQRDVSQENNSRSFSSSSGESTANGSAYRQRETDTYSSYSGRLSVEPQTALNHVASRMKSSGTFWLLIGIYQLIVGVVTLFVGYGIFPIAVGIWNLVNSSKQKKTGIEYANNPIGIISAFENGKTMTIIFIFVNLFLGAGLGVLGSIYDLTTCNYVLSHKDAFTELERRARY